MKRNSFILILNLFLVIIFSCNLEYGKDVTLEEHDVIEIDEYGEWSNIKDSADFTALFNFALLTNDSTLYNNCIDSLEKYKPERSCNFMVYLHFREKNSDRDYYNKLYKGKFFLEDCNTHIDYYIQNVVLYAVDQYDSAHTYYYDNKYDNYESLVNSLLDTISESPNLPDYKIYRIYGDRVYRVRKFLTAIHCKMFPDTLSKKLLGMLYLRAPNMYWMYMKKSFKGKPWNILIRLLKILITLKRKYSRQLL
jgi:hypothetical protein